MPYLATISWANSHFIFGFAGVAACALVLLAYGRWKRRQIARLADAHLLKHILVGYEPRRQYLRWGAAILALGLLVLSLMGPQEPRQRAGTALQGLDALVLLDVSQSMLAADVAPSRLEHARALATQLADTLRGSRMGLILFAGDARLEVPLTDDLFAFQDLLQTANTESVTTDGSNLAEALGLATRSLGKADPRHKAIILLTDGEELQGEALALQDLANLGARLMVVPIGTEKGAALNDRLGSPLADANGARVVSRLQVALLQDLARRAEGIWIQPGTIDLQKKQLQAALAELPLRPVANSYLVNFYSYGHWAIGAAIILLLTSWWWPERRAARRSMAAAAICATVSLFLPQGIMAQSAANQLRQADEWYTQNRFAEARRLYEQTAKAFPEDCRIPLQLGNIAYKSGEYDKAANYYQQSSKLAEKSEEKAAAWNNEALVLSKQQQWPQAIAAWGKALQQQPDDREIQQNMEQAVADMLAQRARPPRPSPPKTNQQQRLQALQQEEQRIRQNLRRKPPRNSDGKVW